MRARSWTPPATRQWLTAKRGAGGPAMQSEGVSLLPSWAQIVFYATFAVVLAVMAARSYVKKKPAKSDAPTTVDSDGRLMAAAIIDRYSIERLTDTLDRHDRTSQRLEDGWRRHCDCLQENTD